LDARWLIEGKFSPPAQPRSEVERARILDQLGPQAARPIVVQAPAGFGKSTVLSQWASQLERSGTRVAWLSLDEDDRQVDTFAAYLVEALRRCLVRGRTAGAPPPASYAGLPAKAALAAVITELGQRHLPVAVVLDDYHRAESADVDALMRLVLDRAPPGVSLAIASRSLPQLGLARLKAEGRATVLHDRDLRFNEDETSLFFAAEMPRLNRADWMRFAARAEGWPVALQFARMWLAEGGSLSALSAAPDASDLGSYLSEQVFSTLPAEQQRFLLLTSPLETVSEGVAEAIGIDRPAIKVKELVRSALPLVILSREPLRFRYHHLFQDYLVSRAQDEAIDLAAIHRRAAGWFARSGDLASAVRHALAGGDNTAAAAIVEEAGGWRLVYRGHGHLGGILRAVHDTFSGPARNAPRLVLGSAVVAAKRGDLARAGRLLDDVVACGPDGDPGLADDLILIDALIKLYCDQPLSEAGLARLAERVGRMDAGDPVALALGTNLVSYFTLEKGDFPRARRAGEQAIRHFRLADALFGALHLHVHIGQAELATGNLAAAEGNYRTMRDICRDRLGEGSDLEAIASVLAAEARYVADDRAAARALLVPALARIEDADGWFDVFAAGYLTAVRLELADHGPAAAAAAIDRGLGTAVRRAMPRLAALLDEERIRVATVAGEAEEAQDACRRAGLSLSVDDAAKAAAPVSSLRGDGHALVAARLLMRLGRPEEAVAFLEAAERQAQKLGAPLTRRITTRVLRALAEEALGRRDQALALTLIATGLAGPSSFSRTLLDEGEAFRAFAEKLLAEPNADPRLRERLRRLFDPHAGEAPPAPRPDDFCLSEREREVLDLLAEGLSNKEIARRIGRDPNTVKYHLKRVFAKLSVERRVTAVIRARSYGLIS
jgi:LuxR family maltose regulon positive regulatory protein